MNARKRTCLTAVLVTAATLGSAAPVPAAPSVLPSSQPTGDHVTVTPIVEYDPEQGEGPEGLAIDLFGRIYVSMAALGEVRRIDRDGSEHTIATLDVGEGLLLGLTVDRPGAVLAALTTFDPATHGVWRVRDNGSTEMVAELDPSGQPNGITTDRAGNIYVGDSLLGLVWRITPDGAVERWSEDPLLVGDFDGGIPDVSFGANGVVVRHGSLYVANTDSARVVRIPIRADGSAGRARTYVEDPQLLGADDPAFDLRGNLYVTTDGLGNSLVRVSRGARTVTTLVDEDDGLDYAAGMKFGGLFRGLDTLYIANIGLNFGRPAVLAVDVGVPGPPFPRAG